MTPRCDYCHGAGSFRSAHSGLELRCPHCAGQPADDIAPMEPFLVMVLGALLIVLAVTLAS